MTAPGMVERTGRRGKRSLVPAARLQPNGRWHEPATGSLPTVERRTYTPQARCAKRRDSHRNRVAITAELRGSIGLPLEPMKGVTVSDIFVHPSGICESDDVGAGSRVWAFAHVMKGAHIGENCNIGEGAFIEGGAKLGNRVTVKNGVAVWDLVTVEDHVFLGPYCVFTNDRIPRSHPDYRTGPDGWDPTLVKEGTTIGANATIVCGVTLGEWSFIAAGSVVTRDVAPYSMVAGNPARRIGWACRCGRRLPESSTCSCGLGYRLEDGQLRPA